MVLTLVLPGLIKGPSELFIRCASMFGGDSPYANDASMSGCLGDNRLVCCHDCCIVTALHHLRPPTHSLRCVQLLRQRCNLLPRPVFAAQQGVVVALSKLWRYFCLVCQLHPSCCCCCRPLSTSFCRCLQCWRHVFSCGVISAATVSAYVLHRAWVIQYTLGSGKQKVETQIKNEY